MINIEEVKTIIKQENELIKISNVEVKRLKEELQKLLNQEFLKVDLKTPLKKYIAQIQPRQDLKINNANLHLSFLDIYEYGNIFYKLSFWFNDTKDYLEKDYYLGKHEKGVLTEIEEYKKIDLLDYKTELNKLVKLKKLTEDYKQAKQEVNYCFEHIYKYF